MLPEFEHACPTGKESNPPMLKVTTFVGSGYAANSHLVIDTETGAAALFDAAVSPARLAERLDKQNAKLTLFVLTHGHYDHILYLPDLRAAYPDIPLCIGGPDASLLTDPHLCAADLFGVNSVSYPKPDRLLSEGDTLNLGDSALSVLSTPGHTPGSCCFLSGTTLISGDTLFAGGYGRYDLPGGDYHALCDSLTRLGNLPAEIKLYPGHGNTSTIGTEKLYNPYLA